MIIQGIDVQRAFQDFLAGIKTTRKKNLLLRSDYCERTHVK